MALAPATAREELHTRAWVFKGYRREDGLFDIEGRLTDTKTYGFENAYRGGIKAGEAIHEMTIRLTLDLDFQVKDVAAVSDETPYAVCPKATASLANLIGERVGRGWRRKVVTKAGGKIGCTHLCEMLVAMGTVAYQTLWPYRQAQDASADTSAHSEGRKPALLNSCLAFASDGEVARESWPAFYTGDK